MSPSTVRLSKPPIWTAYPRNPLRRGRETLEPHRKLALKPQGDYGSALRLREPPTAGDRPDRGSHRRVAYGSAG